MTKKRGQRRVHRSIWRNRDNVSILLWLCHTAHFVHCRKAQEQVLGPKTKAALCVLLLPHLCIDMQVFSNEVIMNQWPKLLRRTNSTTNRKTPSDITPDVVASGKVIPGLFTWAYNKGISRCPPQCDTAQLHDTYLILTLSLKIFQEWLETGGVHFLHG